MLSIACRAYIYPNLCRIYSPFFVHFYAPSSQAFQDRIRQKVFEEDMRMRNEGSFLIPLPRRATWRPPLVWPHVEKDVLLALWRPGDEIFDGDVVLEWEDWDVDGATSEPILNVLMTALVPVFRLPGTQSAQFVLTGRSGRSGRSGRCLCPSCFSFFV